MFNAYRIRTANDCEDRDPQDWTVTVDTVDPLTNNHIASQVEGEAPRGRLETKSYLVENLVWVTKITLEVTKAQDGNECQLCEFEILTDQSVMAPQESRLPWIYGADEIGVNFTLMPEPEMQMPEMPIIDVSHLH